MQPSSMTEIIYDYFTSRIRFGYFEYGDRLPSINYTCRQFQISALTVRAAFSKMREEGYVETTERKSSIVIYRPEEREERQDQASVLSRTEGMIDLCESYEILFRPLVLSSLRLQSPASVKQIRAQLKKMKGHPAKRIIKFYSKTMEALNNTLALNLSWEIVRYFRTSSLRRPVPYDEGSDPTVIHIERILTLAEGGNAEQAEEALRELNSGVKQMFFEGLPADSDEKRRTEQLPFQWQIYREHPQLCYTLAAEMMGKIDAQLYKPGEFLPSCRSLAEEYGVSLITMRRTLELLGDLRVTETRNGVGTKVISGRSTSPPNFSHLKIRKSLLLYLQALQISALTCKNVAIHTLSPQDGRNLRALDQEIKQLTEGGVSILLAGTCLRFIGEHSSSAFIREVYRQLYQLLLWGHALHRLCQNSKTEHFYEAYAARFGELLRHGDVRGFADELEEMVTTGVRISKKLLLELGFPEDQLI